MWKWENVNFPGMGARLRNVMASYEKICGINEQNLLININHKTKSLYPVYFGGLKFNINKLINENLLYNCKLNIDTSNPTNYKSYNRFINKEPLTYPGESDSPGFFNLIFKQNISDNWKCIVLAHFLPQGGGGLDCTMNYYSDSFTGSFSVCNKNVTGVVITGNYLQEVNKNLSVGAEVASEVGTVSMMSKFTIAGKYFDIHHNIIISGSIGTKGSQICLYKMLAPKFCVGSVVDYLFDDKTAFGSLVGQWTEEQFILRCSIDSNRYVGMNLLRSIYIDENVHVNINWGSFTNFKDEIKVGIGLDFFIKN